MSYDYGASLYGNGPAMIYADGTKIYYKNGVRHRDNGPAVVNDDTGFSAYYINGKLHREDGPAEIHAGGYLKYYINGKKHRTDGPAVTWAIEWTAGEEYWINGKLLTKDEFDMYNFVDSL